MLTGPTLALYAIWRYNYVRISFNFIADQDPYLQDVLNHLGVEDNQYSQPYEVLRGSDGKVSARYGITQLNGSTLYILDSVTVGSQTTYCDSGPCTIVDLVDIDTDVVVTAYSHHAIFNYSITYIGIDTSTTISGSGPSVTLADAHLFGMVANAVNGDTFGFVDGWVRNGSPDPTGYHFELEGDFVDTYTAAWTTGVELNVMVATGVGGTIRWVDPRGVDMPNAYENSTRSEQKTYWFQDMMPHLPYFKIEPDAGYEIASIKFQGREVIESIYDARYKGGQMISPAYECDIQVPTNCFFTFSEFDARVPYGDLVFEFRETFNYSFAFDAGGGALVDGETDTARIGSGTRFLLPETPYAKEGHNFSAWMDSQGSMYRVGNYIDITQDRVDTFTAVWQIQRFAVTFAGNENGIVASTSSHDGSYDYDSSDTFSVTPNSGFCVGPYFGVSGQTMFNGTNYEAAKTFSLVGIRGDVTVTVDIHSCAHQFTINKYDNVGNGTGTTVNVATDRYFNIPATPTQPSGASFLFWATSADGSGDTYTAGQLIDLASESFTAASLYGQWELSIVIANNDANWDDASLPEVTTNLDSFIVSKSCTYYNTQFDHILDDKPYWGGVYQTGNSEIRCSNFVLKDGARLNPDHVIAPGTIFVHVHYYNYTVNFDLQGGSPALDPQTGYFNMIIMPANRFAGTRAGYVNDGWAIYPGGARVYTIHLSSEGTNRTVYARWIPNTLTVTYDSQGGSDVSAGTVLVGDSLSEPTAPTRANFVFGGWSDSPTGTAVAFPYAHGKTSNFTLYALWTPDLSNA
jgi:uncharacterized repeat protein (TIGR02543 family)